MGNALLSNGMALDGRAEAEAEHGHARASHSRAQRCRGIAWRCTGTACRRAAKAEDGAEGQGPGTDWQGKARAEQRRSWLRLRWGANRKGMAMVGPEMAPIRAALQRPSMERPGNGYAQGG